MILLTDLTKRFFDEFNNHQFDEFEQSSGSLPTQKNIIEKFMKVYPSFKTIKYLTISSQPFIESKFVTDDKDIPNIRLNQ